MRLTRFVDVVGNVSTVNLLCKSLQNDSFPNFSIFNGEPGVGKSTCAELSALRLTCENPIGREPCHECASCRKGINVIFGKGTSMNFKKINLGQRNEKSDIDEIIKEVFKVDTGDDKCVFIFEEAHVLSIIHQTSLLEEIDRIPDNVYVIICTTKIQKLLPELKSRALKFQFGSLKPKESNLLIDNITRGLDISKRSKDLIVRYSKGVPRVICNTALFLAENKCSEEEVRDYLNVLNTDMLRMCFKSYADFSMYMELVEDLISSTDSDNLIYSIKNYLMELCILSKDVSYRETNLGIEDKKFANLIGFGTLLKIFNDFNNLKEHDDTSIMYTFIKARKYIEAIMIKRQVDKEEKPLVKTQAQFLQDNRNLRNESVKESNSFKPMTADEFSSLIGES